MIRKILPIIAVTILTATQTNAFCFPCPREGLTYSSFHNCNCPSNKFYDEEAKKCVRYSECPIPTLRNPLPDIKMIAPDLHEFLTSTLEMFSPKTPNISKDVQLFTNALKKRMDEVKKNLPVLLGPIIGTVALKNNDLFDKCGGKVGCMIREALKREENYDYIFPKLKPVFDKVIRILHGVFDDLKEVSKKSCGKDKEDCPLIKGLINMKELVPGNLEEVMDMHQIATQINRYLMKDMKRQLNLPK